MNLPNKLTVVRVLLIPLFLFFFFADAVPLHFFWSLVVFGAAAFTDTLDGRIARRDGLITDFGKLMDPLADKLLVMAAMVSLITQGMVHAVVVIVILAREFLVTAIRQLAASNGQVLAADNWGKLKTVAQMIWISVSLLYLEVAVHTGGLLAVLVTPLKILCVILMILVLAATVFSGWNYLWKNRKLFADM